MDKILDISVIVIASLSLVVSIIVGLNVIESGERNNELMERSVELTEETKEISKNQFDAENFIMLFSIFGNGVDLNNNEQDVELSGYTSSTVLNYTDHGNVSFKKGEKEIRFLPSFSGSENLDIKIRYTSKNIISIQVVNGTFNPNEKFSCLFSNSSTVDFSSKSVDLSNVVTNTISDSLNMFFLKPVQEIESQTINPTIEYHLEFNSEHYIEENTKAEDFEILQSSIGVLYYDLIIKDLVTEYEEIFPVKILVFLNYLPINYDVQKCEPFPTINLSDIEQMIQE